MTTDLESELEAERTHMAVSRAALHEMRVNAERMYASGAAIAGDPFAAETLGIAMARRVAELADDPRTPLFFGRLDFSLERFYVGRRHVTDAAGDPLVLDWRAPLSRSFYQASVRDPQEVKVRRRFGFSGGELTSFEDEHLGRGEELGTSSRILIQEIERPRVGPMRDIVATIQPEQDELVRADLDTSICVQGAPGTGKTAVGLHRAAYLLYVHRERLRRSGVVIVGPNQAFLGYIAAVLPALGELEVTQSTLDDLIARTPVSATDSVAAQTVKHDPRMAEVLHRALWSRVAEPAEPIQVSDGAYRWRIDRGVLARLVAEVRAEGLPYLLGRERLRARVVSLLQRQAEARSGESPPESWQRRMGRSKPVVAFLDAAWPAVTAEAVVFEVLTAPEVADGILTPDEQEALRPQRTPRTVRTAKWSSADLVLLDEAAGLLERRPSVSHVVIDEAQDLSPMQCRAIARRTGHGSITLLGDLAQGTTPWAATDWRDSLRHLGKPDAAIVPLTTGFRVPEAVVALANRLLPALDVNVPPAVSLRRDGNLTVRAVTDIPAALAEEIAAARGFPGSVAVIAAEAQIDALRVAYAEDEQVTYVPATLAKGLEYDHVIVVEPRHIVEAEPRGLHRLYVVLTRAVSRLSILHHKPLPSALVTSGGAE
jgi:DNA helicase IV